MGPEYSLRSARSLRSLSAPFVIERDLLVVENEPESWRLGVQAAVVVFGLSVIIVGLLLDLFERAVEGAVRLIGV